MRVHRSIHALVAAASVAIGVAALPRVAAGLPPAPAASAAASASAAPSASASPAPSASAAAPEPAAAPPAASANAEPAPSASASAVPYELERPPRPPLPPEAPRANVPWKRAVEIGGDAVWAIRTAETVSGPSNGIRYKDTLGFGLHLRFPIVRWLEFTAYFYDADHDADIPNGALGPRGTVEMPPIETFAFGARLSPTLHLGDRFRIWLTGGAGWGRMQVGRMTIHETNGDVLVRERSNPYVEFPIGAGTGFEIIKNWIVLEYEITGAFVANQSSTAVTPFQGWAQEQNGTEQVGRIVTINPFPGFGSTWIQTLGLSLIL